MSLTTKTSFKPEPNDRFSTISHSNVSFIKASFAFNTCIFPISPLLMTTKAFEDDKI